MKNLYLTGVAALALCAVPALAQTISVPQVNNVGPADLFADVVGGVATARSSFAKGGQIAAVSLYKNGTTISADPAYTFTNGVLSYFAHAAATLTSANLTTEAAPTDGKRECYWLDATTTSLNWTANTGQTIGTGVPTAGVAKTTTCITYQASNATWYGSP